MAVKGKTRICQSNIGDFNVELINGSPFYNRYPEFLRVFRKNLIGLDAEMVFAQPQENAAKGMVDWYLPTDTPEVESLASLRTSDPEEYQRYSAIRDRTMVMLRDAHAAIGNPQERAYLACAMKYLESEYAERVTYCCDNQVSFAVWGMTMRKGRTFETVITEDVRDHRFHNVSYNVQGQGTIQGDANFVRKHGHVLQGARDIPQVVPADHYGFVRWEPTAPQGQAVTADLFFTAVCERTSPYQVSFDADEGGLLEGVPFVDKKPNEPLSPNDFPKVVASAGYRFSGWQPQPQIGSLVNEDMNFRATFAPDPTAVVPPVNEPLAEPVNEPEHPADHEVTFSAGQHGTLDGCSNYHILHGMSILPSQIPLITPFNGYEFVGWDGTVTAPVNKDVVFTAVYRKAVAPVTPVAAPPAAAAPVADSGMGCLHWLLYALLALLLLLFAAFLFRSCYHGHEGAVVPWVHHRVHPVLIEEPDTLVSSIDRRQIEGDGNQSIYLDDNGYAVPFDGALPEEYVSVTPPLYDEDGTILPFEERDNQPDVASNRLFLFMYDDNDLEGLKSDFERAYTSEGFGTIGYDKEVPYLVVQVPEGQRDQVRQTINQRIPNHKFICIDESIYQLSSASHNAPASDSRLTANEQAAPRRNLRVPFGSVSESNAPAGWHLDAVHAKQAWQATKGKPEVTVAVIDDGIDASHPIFQGRLVNAYNVFRQDNHLSMGEGHGTHVAALAVGSALYLSRGVSGLAPSCKLMPVQVFDNGSCSLSSLVAGVMYAVNHGADVVNVSVCMDVPALSLLNKQQQELLANTQFKNEERLWDRICEIAKQKNAIIVFAAGNNNALANISPTNRSDISITVAAVDQQKAEASFSNHGAGADISAPGVGIVSAFPNNSFKSFDGTSMAAPIVTGILALMKSKNKNITAQQALAILKRTGVQTRGDVPPLVQADKALAAM